QVGGAGAEATHRLGVAPRRHRDPVFIGTHVDAGGVGVGHRQGPPPRPRCGGWGGVSAWRHGRLPAPWPRGVTTAAGAGATGTEAVSQTGSRRSVSPVLWSLTPGTILTDGHEAPRSRRSPRPAAPKHIVARGQNMSRSSVLWAA